MQGVGKGQYEIVYKLISGSGRIILPLTFSLVRTLIRIHLAMKNTGEFGYITIFEFGGVVCQFLVTKFATGAQWYL